jgi:hypothetical protein
MAECQRWWRVQNVAHRGGINDLQRFLDALRHSSPAVLPILLANKQSLQETIEISSAETMFWCC